MADSGFGLGRLDGKVTLISGASSGIGAGTAKMFSKLGAKLALTGRNEDNLKKVGDECEKLGGNKVVCIPGDLTVEEDVSRIVDEAVKHHGQLDILVNSAGIVELGTIETTSLEQYDRLMNTNVRAMYHLTMLAVPHLVQTKGSIVNVSSVNGIRSVDTMLKQYAGESKPDISNTLPGSNSSVPVAVPMCDRISNAEAKAMKDTEFHFNTCSKMTQFPNVLAYNMSKSAVDQFTRCCALDLAPKQVRVNSVNPGVIITEIHKRGGLDDEAYQMFLERTKFTHALGRPGQVEEVAAMIAFLASENASFITGAQIPVDGGRHAMCPR